MKEGITMKMKVSILLVIVLLMALLFAGCGATKDNSAISKQAMNDYYTYYNDGQLDSWMTIIHPALQDALGGTQATEDLFNARHEFYGNVTEYEIKQTGFETVNGESEFYYTVTTKYQSGDEFEETFAMFVTDGVAQIITIKV
jgi:ABC-type glycerol-3-phosphate transport system substrate-binding protein